MKLLSKLKIVILSVIVTLVFFWQFIFKGLLPIPADTIVGLYHPYIDFFSDKYPRGIPFKNYLITDPIRQQYLWKNLAINLEKRGESPLWNPYSFSGIPLLGNFQSGAFYPLNFIFFILPFGIAWGLFITLQTLLMSFFMFIFLRNLKLNILSSALGSIVFPLSGFSIAWLEWGNIGHTLLWLPLILLSIDKILAEKNRRWSFIFLFSLVSSFLAGHLQIFFYVFVVTLFYAAFKLLDAKNRHKTSLLIFLVFAFVFLTFYQWEPVLRFIMESARNLDQGNWQKLGWFIPLQNSIQFLAPDFFGNPATLNYRGVFNYGEFIGYIGIAPLMLSFYAIFQKKEKNLLFFVSLLFLSLLFSFQNIIAQIPFLLKIPFLSTAQPTRLMAITDFSLVVLASFGLDKLVKNGKNFYRVIYFFAIAFAAIWLYILKLHLGGESSSDLAVSKNNLYLPTIIFVVSSCLFIVRSIKKTSLAIFILFVVVLLDLLRFGWKFDPFTKKDYLYPNTKSLSFLESQKGQFRIMSTDPRIFSPNFSIAYKLQSIEGYDPLYLRRYGELIAAMERNSPDITPPFGFNRIITPHNFSSPIADLLNVKYVLSLSDLSFPKLSKVYQEGETRVYLNKNVIDRAFFVRKTLQAKNEKDSIKKLFEVQNDFKNTAIVEGNNSKSYSQGRASIIKYEENKILIRTKNNGEGFLVLTDSFYPTWRAKIDGKETRIFLTDFNFRGIVVPQGEHNIEFYINFL